MLRKLTKKSKLVQGSNLVVCPLSVLSAWNSIIPQHSGIPPSEVIEFHGSAKQRLTQAELASKMIVLTTYGMLYTKSGAPSVLHGIHWRRIILDEAHGIRNINSHTTKAVLSLSGDRRWCLTGTPIQNKLSDLHPLMAFVRAFPFEDKAVFKMAFGSDDRPASPEHEGVKLALASIMLRRTKELTAYQESASTDVKCEETTPLDFIETPVLRTVTETGSCESTPAESSLMNLPSKTIEVLTVELTEEERESYKALEKAAGSFLRSRSGTPYFAIYALMTHLRLLANTEEILCDEVRARIQRLISGDLSTEEREQLCAELVQTKQMETLLTGSQEETHCPICFEPYSDTLTKCRHSFHGTCLLEWIGESSQPCPVCREPLTINSIMDTAQAEQFKRKLMRADQNKLEPVQLPNRVESSKVQAVCDRVLNHIQEGEGGTKIVIFSSFVKLLRHIEISLKERGIRTLLFSGEMSNKARRGMVRTLQNSPHSMVLLASTKAAGQGLTLTAAHIVYIFDPWWNPHAEDQAIDRVHRIGQKKAVQVYKVVAKGTIEEMVLGKQREKRELAEKALLGGKVTRQTLSREEVYSLLTSAPTTRNESGRTIFPDESK
eukprot:Gregarina_sp_Poly_1__1426@NODE_1356_length_4306_cov_69_264685_g66_i1_p2_GENE_NODE_1356_length_4306_cov_69_264685_g66_i1NODE_1356_length_4306_cov_69_264685_g66_i1_p2_ORF_typecomplete_len607_score82_87SNF2_N/PF00176_23/1_4e44Helicase_C/PF00271_31/4_5e03Helicase_C/PF00271_31/4_6e16zfC3HC4/PF00097_25/3_3e10zfC3HC4_2/PF13923_6/6_1e10zfRING_2/PF13639_6/4_1e09zfRING_UBOX/PF13445_6/1_5e07zfRING_UBOX/PF13445_6/25zfRING_5/PF14634_6/2_5e08ERCC3_RAD25_C/PF16203_5/1_7e02ERCC3_RAD25_C/PF16203_5/3_5e07zfC3HC4_